VHVGQTEVIRRVAPHVRDFTQAKASRNKALSAVERAKNRNKSKVRAKGEHPFLVIKRLFGFAKVCYRGFAKNANRLFVPCALANLFMVRRTLPRAQHRYS
jgi:IS5 family transposase